jgi:hypothetical protein
MMVFPDLWIWLLRWILGLYRFCLDLDLNFWFSKVWGRFLRIGCFS